MAPHFSARGRARLRKNNKPEAERRRRARMAQAVERLRRLLGEEGAAPLPPPPCTPPHLHHLAPTHRRGARQRMEKVVVLELTVAHLRHLATHHPGDVGRQQFREGYQRCQEEVMRFLGRTAAHQLHAASKLWHQVRLTSPDTANRDGHPSPARVRVTRGHHSPVVGKTHAAPGGVDAPHVKEERPSQPQPDAVVVSAPGAPCVSASAPSCHAPYAHVHWKKYLKPPSRSCFWRPW